MSFAAILGLEFKKSKPFLVKLNKVQDGLNFKKNNWYFNYTQYPAH